MVGEALSYHGFIKLRKRRAAKQVQDEQEQSQTEHPNPEKVVYLPFESSCYEAEGLYRMVICLAISALAVDPAPEMLPAVPAFFSNTFQNLRLSSAAAVASI